MLQSATFVFASDDAQPSVLTQCKPYGKRTNYVNELISVVRYLKFLLAEASGQDAHTQT